jgi:uncharacterized protein involved in response to NO
MAIPAALSRRRDYEGPVLLSAGFRPFFLAASIWAAFGVALWVPVYLGMIALPARLSPLEWHIHEMLYGYTAAAIAGFLLTAIPNWTGRLPVNGMPLAALALIWLAGRIAMIAPVTSGTLAGAAIDLAFLVSLAALAAREIVAGRNWRNLRVLAIVGILIAGNFIFHYEAIYAGGADYGVRIAIASVITLIVLIGGRIVPSFTNNWLVKNRPGRLPKPFSRFDAGAILAAAIAFVLWVAGPANPATGVALIAAGVLHAVRLARWAGGRTLSDPLVFVLHVAYAFVPLGFLLNGAAALSFAVPPSAGIHAWTAGAAGLMTLAVMTRASLGHSGRPLAASRATQIIYVLVGLAAVSRIAAAFEGGLFLLYFSALAWIAAFVGFALVYGPLLIGKPPAWQQRIR